MTVLAKPAEATAANMISIAGVELEMLERGDGAPMLYLHGGAGIAPDLAFIDLLARRRRVIAPSHPGFGKSSLPDWLDSVDDIAHVYLELLDRLALARTDVVGLSLGGWIAAELAIRNTARLASLTLVCAVGVRPEEGAKGDAMADMFRMSPEDNARRFYFDPDRVQRRLDGLAKADPRVLVRNRSTVVRLCYPDFINPELAKWLHRIDTPTLLIWGANDGLVPLSFGETYRALVPRARLTVLPRAGHAPYEEQPEAFLQAFDDFLKNSNVIMR